MPTTTIGVKIDPELKQRLAEAAHSVERTPHWFVKHALIDWLNKVESGAKLNELIGLDFSVERSGLSQDYL